MSSMTEIICRCGCRRKKMVRTADVKRGWGKFFSKACKATHQEARTGQHTAYLHNRRRQDDGRDPDDQGGIFDDMDDMDGQFSNEDSYQWGR